MLKSEPMMSTRILSTEIKKCPQSATKLTRPRPLPPTMSRSRSSCSILGADPPKGKIFVTVMVCFVVIFVRIYEPRIDGERRGFGSASFSQPAAECERWTVSAVLCCFMILRTYELPPILPPFPSPPNIAIPLIFCERPWRPRALISSASRPRKRREHSTIRRRRRRSSIRSVSMSP